MWHQFCGDFHITLLSNHLPDDGFIIIGFVMTGLGTLPQTVISLGVEQMAFVKARTLELVILLRRYSPPSSGTWKKRAF